MAVLRFKSLPSTNRYVREHHGSLSHFDVITCDEQTTGTGRHDNTWHADSDSLVFSIMLKDVPKNATADLLPFFAAHVIHAVLKTYASGLKIKWPNDIYVGDKKIAGILLKRFFTDNQTNVVVGAGINVNNPSFPDSIRDKATSLFMETNSRLDPSHILAEIIKCLKEGYETFFKHPEETIDYVNDHGYLNNKVIRFIHNQKAIFGKCLKTDISGCLLVQTGKDVIQINSADTHNLRIKKSRLD